MAPTPSDPETRSLANANARDLESSALLSPSGRIRRDSVISAASEPPELSAEEVEDLMMKRGSISRQTIKRMFTGEQSSRSPTRSRSPANLPRSDLQSNLRSQGYQEVDIYRVNPDNFEIGADSDTER